MQHKLEPGRLLYDDGNLAEAGYATSLVKEYNRSWIKAHSLRIKEWDYYYIGNENHGIALTIADNSYMSMVSISFLNFVSKTETTKSIIKFFPKRKLNLPSTSETGDIEYNSKKCNISFKHVDGKRRIQANFKNFDNKIDLRCDLYLTETNEDSIVIATPFKKNKHFYYNQKINLRSSSGYVKIGETIYDFNKDTYGVLDWGRGVWTYKNTWYWSSLSYEDENHNRIGFNLGSGFGDTSKASENMLFVNKNAYKFDDCVFDIPKDKNNKEIYLNKWKIYSNNKDIDLEFTPLIDRHDKADVLIIAQDAHQVFGLFNGKFKTDDGEIIIKDALGFAEKVKNRW